MMKENLSAARGCLVSCKSFGALSAHVNLILATNSYLKLLPLSTHSKQGRVFLRRHRQFGRLAAHSRVAIAEVGMSFREISHALLWGGGFLSRVMFFHSKTA
jgi:hypothetical protein